LLDVALTHLVQGCGSSKIMGALDWEVCGAAIFKEQGFAGTASDAKFILFNLFCLSIKKAQY